MLPLPQLAQNHLFLDAENPLGQPPRLLSQKHKSLSLGHCGHF